MEVYSTSPSTVLSTLLLNSNRTSYYDSLHIQADELKDSRDVVMAVKAINNEDTWREESALRET
jgi:hypothetical protein